MLELLVHVVIGILGFIIALVVCTAIVEAALVVAAVPRRGLRWSLLSALLLGLWAVACFFAVVVGTMVALFLSLALLLGLLIVVPLIRWFHRTTLGRALVIVLASGLFLAVLLVTLARIPAVLG
ncbi:MAG: hypothetical protein J7M26_09990 [Armatimonadetes bacterium]|nr:hypothetical protein [Armatimonadota bacterium]